MEKYLIQVFLLTIIEKNSGKLPLMFYRLPMNIVQIGKQAEESELGFLLYCIIKFDFILLICYSVYHKKIWSFTNSQSRFNHPPFRSLYQCIPYTVDQPSIILFMKSGLNITFFCLFQGFASPKTLTTWDTWTMPNISVMQILQGQGFGWKPMDGMQWGNLVPLQCWELLL